MKFCDKLPKIRKDNNLSQEQLADRLGISRQAISKWEAGLSYPDMEKMIELCKILNCKLEDLLDDGTIGNNVNIQKKNLNDYFQDFLKYITKIYNMFLAMSIKEKTKCITEMFFITLFIFIIEHIIYSFIKNIGIDIFSFFPFEFFNFILIIFGALIKTAIFVIGFVVILHLFNIRYLNYYLTVEDENIKKKTFEPAIEEIKNSTPIKEKIIIRDPKDSSFNFFNLLTKITILTFKIFSVFMFIPITFSFIFLIGLSALSFCYLSYTSLFLYSAGITIGCALICLIIMYFVYNFIFNKNIKFKMVFIVFISSLLLVGINSGLFAGKILQFNYIPNNDDLKIYTKVSEIDIQKNTHFINYDINYIIDNNLTTAKLEVSSIVNYKNFKVKHHNYFNDNNKIFDAIYIDINEYSFKNILNLVLNDFKNNQFRNYSSDDIFTITIYLNEDDYNIIKSNRINY